MEKFNEFLDTFMKGDFFVIFLFLMLLILIILIFVLAKTREQYLEILEKENNKYKNQIKTENYNESKKQIKTNESKNELFGDLMATSKEDEIDNDKPLIKQVDTSSLKSYENVIDDYEFSEEENAVISAEELERKLEQRMETLGISDNQAAIQKYEEDQEKKAIISYQQLLKNASNIKLTYKEEENVDNDAPRINKIVIEQKDIIPAENYLKEEEYLNVLKEFRVKLQ